MSDPSSPLQHFVILEEGDADGHPQKRICSCPLGRDHFFDEPIQPAERMGATVQFNVQYRDDVHVCLYTRFGRMHDPHLYSYIHPEGNGVGLYSCEGLVEEEAGNPYPIRPRPRTGILADDLADDLVSWWHVYGASEVWEVTGESLPLDLGAAAKLYVEHITTCLTQRMEETMRLKDRAWRAERETQLPLIRVCPDAAGCNNECGQSSCWRVKHGGPLSGLFPHDEWPEKIRRENGVFPVQRPRKTWSIGSPEPVVPNGFTVAPNWDHLKKLDDRNVYVKTAHGWLATGPDLDGVVYSWERVNGTQAENGGTPLIEVLIESEER